MKMKGRQLGEIRIRDSKEFALSWRESSDRVLDCGARLIVSNQGSSYPPADRNIRAIREFPTPTTTKAVKATAELLNDYRRFNKAVSRYRHGQIIFGHAESLRKVPT
uniref:Transposase n=1 Tax=Haemonchus contortus TaxID=6289 RepID=A0A7I4Z3G4_HAECO